MQNKRKWVNPWTILAIAIVGIGIVTWRARDGLDSGDAGGDAAAAAAGKADAVSAKAQPAFDPRTSRTAQGRNGVPGLPREQIAEMMRKRAAERAMMAEQYARLNAAAASRYRQERVDPAWAGSKERVLAKVAEGLDGGPAELSTECRSTLCKTEATFADRSAADAWISMYMASLGDSMRRSVVSVKDNPDGTVLAEIYGSAR